MSKPDTTTILKLYKAFYREHNCFPTYDDLALVAGEHKTLIMRRPATLASGENAPLVDRGKSRTYRYQPSSATLKAWLEEAVEEA